MYKIRCWLYTVLMNAAARVAPKNVRSVHNRALRFGMDKLERDWDEQHKGRKP